LQNAGVPGASFYPPSSKVYLASLVGFAAPPTTPPESALAVCENNPAISALLVRVNHWVPLPTTYNAGNAFCEDFNENVFCPPAANVNACNGTQALGLGVVAPPPAPICGNNAIEAFEECDPPGPACSNICRKLP
jgi:hypothetical protein